MVIEDDRSSLELLTLYLEGVGVEVVGERDGPSGLDAVRRRHPAAVVLDIRLPDMDGWEVLTALKADPVTAEIPVVVVSMLDERGMGFALGAAEYLVKPVSREHVLAALSRVGVLPEAGTLLVIDDDPLALELVTAVLEPTRVDRPERGRRRDRHCHGPVTPAVGGAPRLAHARYGRVRRGGGFAQRQRDQGDPDCRADFQDVDPRRQGPLAGTDLVRGAEERVRPGRPRGPGDQSYRRDGGLWIGDDVTAQRILVVEDNERNLKLIRDVLQFAGYEVVEATSGEQGVALAQDCEPDLVLMDLQLPQMDGTEALRLLRESPRTRDVPVVAVTAFAMREDRERAFGAGFDGYLQKPISIRALPEQVRGFLAGKGSPG